jgi:hypothetical protein
MADALGRRHLPEKRPRAGRLCQLGGASLSVERDRLPHRHGGGERDRPQVVVEDAGALAGRSRGPNLQACMPRRVRACVRVYLFII